MQISKLRIRNFRSIQSLDVDLSGTTVFIGPNNAGKTAILEALRIALTRRWGKAGTGFTEYDIHCPTPDGDPKSLPPVSITITLEETKDSPWHEDLVAALDDIMAIGPSGRNVISLRVTWAWSNEDEQFKPDWQFLDAADQPLTGKAARAINFSGFYDYLPFYALSALRDAMDEFGPRSTQWGRLLRGVKIPDPLKAEVKAELDDLDGKLLAADPRLNDIAATVGQATHVAITDVPGAARLRMLPLNTWDLLSRASILLRNSDIRPWLPLDHHGQGLQSLSVIFLLQAVALQFLAEENRPGMESVFTIEEPEAHLHPQAARTLWTRISALPGQKLATTHSPYFVQHVPLHDLRLVRLCDGRTEISAIPQRLVSNLAWNDEIATLAKHSAHMLSPESETGVVTSTESFEEDIAIKLANCLGGTTADSAAVGNFRRDCRILVSKEDEDDLNITGRRLRGEIFFARKWLLVEGPSDYLLVHAIADALGWSLDQHGVAVIDFQNNSNPGVYAALAEALQLPWRIIADGDGESEKFKKQLSKRGFNQADIDTHVMTLPAGNNLEGQLLADGHEGLLRSILQELTFADALTCTLDELRAHLRKCKMDCMSVLAKKVIKDPVLAERMPAPFVDTIKALKAGTL